MKRQVKVRKPKKRDTPANTRDYIMRLVDWHSGVTLRRLREACGHREDFRSALYQLRRKKRLVTWLDVRPNISGPKPVMVGRPRHAP